MFEAGEAYPEESALGTAPDAVLLEARDQARDALLEITSENSIGSYDGYEVNEPHVLTQFFECRLPGYPGWRWAATLARTDEDAPVTVLEVELLPGEGAVVAPEWVPWSERLAQYRNAQAKQSAEASEDGDDLNDDEFDGEAEEDELDDGLDGDIDGVEFDEESDELDNEDEVDDEDDDEGLGDDSDDTELFDEDSDDVDSDDEGADDDDLDIAARGNGDDATGSSAEEE